MSDGSGHRFWPIAVVVILMLCGTATARAADAVTLPAYPSAGIFYIDSSAGDFIVNEFMSQSDGSHVAIGATVSAGDCGSSDSYSCEKVVQWLDDIAPPSCLQDCVRRNFAWVIEYRYTCRSGFAADATSSSCVRIEIASDRRAS